MRRQPGTVGGVGALVAALGVLGALEGPGRSGATDGRLVMVKTHAPRPRR